MNDIPLALKPFSLLGKTVKVIAEADDDFVYNIDENMN